LFALAATAVEKGGGMILLLAIARLLGTEQFGRYAALMSLVALFQVATEFGLEPVLVRLLAQERAPAADVVPAALTLRLVLAIVAAAFLVPLGAVALPAIGRVPLALGAVGLVAGSGLVMRGLFRAVQRLEWLIVTGFVTVSAFGATLLVARPFELGLAGAVGAWAVGQLAGSTAAGTLAARRVTVWPRWNGRLARMLAGSGWALALNALLLTITLRVGQLIVLRLEDSHSVALLAAGGRLAEAFALLPEAVMLALLPVLAAYDRDARASQRALGVRATRVLGLLALPVVIVLSIAAPDVLGLLYGPAYVGGAPALRVLAWLALLAASGTVFTNLLIARGHERLLLALNALSSVLTIAITLIAVPSLGFAGAATATLAASIVPQAVLLALPATHDDVAACLRPLVWPTLLGLALIVAGMAAPGPRLPVAAAALGAYVLMLLATRTVGRGDWLVARRLFTSP
jgi:PST family polysaccharide transporter